MLEPQPQERALRSRLRILEAAHALFAARGFDTVTIRDVAEKAELSVGLVCRYFPTREHLARAIYEQLADELAAAAVELPPGSLATRFRSLITLRIEQCEAHRRTLTALLGKALDPESPLSALGEATESIRAKVYGALGVVVAGASDAPSSDADIGHLTQALYSAQLGVILATLVRRNADSAHVLVDGISTGLKWARPSYPLLRRFFASRWKGLLVDPIDTRVRKDEVSTARELLVRLFRDNRVLPDVPHGLTPISEQLHLPRMLTFVRAGRPVKLVLPAFPAKAPNPHKVLGKLPDLAEERALSRLSELLDSLEDVWPQGAQLTICSDGHVFADAVGVSDGDVDRYRDALLPLIDDPRITWFDLSTAFGDTTPERRRALLMERYASSVDALRERASASPPLRAQIDGIHRFLVEDAVAQHPELTRTQVKKLTRENAYEVVRRSEAWGALVGAVYPEALRLSIHPQPDPSTKIGINLLGLQDAWLTPWHAAAVVGRTGTTLMHRADAEALGARVVLDQGRPTHLELP